MLLDELVIVCKACLRGGTHHELPVLYKSRSAGLLCWDCADSAARVKPGHCSPFAPDDSLSLPHHSVFSHLIRLFSPWLPLEDLRHLCPRLLIFPPLHVNSVWRFFLFIYPSRRAVEELLRETDRARVRAETMGPAGWWAQCLTCHLSDSYLSALVRKLGSWASHNVCIALELMKMAAVVCDTADFWYRSDTRYIDGEYCRYQYLGLHDFLA